MNLYTEFEKNIINIYIYYMSNEKPKIENIEIMITTNAGGNPQPLTFDMLHIPVQKNDYSDKNLEDDENIDKDKDKDGKTSKSTKYPFICSNAKIPIDTLKFKTQKEIALTLFNEEKFTAIMKSVSVEKHYKHNAILAENVMTILKLLFTNTFPFTNDIISSYDHLIENSIVDVGFADKKRSSFIKLNGNIHTVTRAVWLNDVLNHPLYNDLIKTMNKYFIWAEKNKYKIISDETKELKSIATEIFNFYKGENFPKKRRNKNNDVDITDSELLKNDADEIVRNAYRSSKPEREYEKSRYLLFLKNDFHDNIVKIVGSSSSKKSDDIKVNEIIDIIRRLKNLKNIVSIVDLVQFDYIKRSLIELKKYTESSIYLFNLYVLKNGEPIIDLKAPKLESIKSQFKIYDETKEKLKNFCGPSIDFKGGIVSRNKYVISNGNYIEDNTSIQYLIENYVQKTSNNTSDKDDKKPSSKNTEDTNKEGENTKESQNATSFIQYINQVTIVEKSKDKVLANSNLELGVNEFNFEESDKPRFQIYVKLDLLQGELNEKNIKFIKCKFDDLFLTNKFMKIVYRNPKFWVPDEHPYVKIEDLKDPKLVKEAAAKEAAANKNKVKKQGGKRFARTRKRRNNRLKKYNYSIRK